MGRFIGTICILIVLAALLHAGAPVKAAQPDTVPVSDNCEQVAEVGIIQYFYCENDYGPDMLVNSLGFMVVVD